MLGFVQFCAKAARAKDMLAWIAEIGRAVLHLGSRRHGADDIENGTRMNLIIWPLALNLGVSKGHGESTWHGH